MPPRNDSVRPATAVLLHPRWIGFRRGRLPHAIAASPLFRFNVQTVPHTALGGADKNLLPGLDGPRNRRTGLEILHGLLIDYLRPLDGVAEVALCGSGFTAPRSPSGLGGIAA